MDLSEMLVIGEKIDVRYKGKNETETEKLCYSMVQDIVSQDEIIITMPMLEGVQIILEPEQEIEIDFFREEGCYSFKARVDERFKTDGLNLVKVSRISPVNRLQRRNYYRLKITLPIYVRILTNDPDKEPDSWLEAYTLNLSGGGAKISVNRSIDKGTLIECLLRIKDQDLILRGEVLRCQLAQDDVISRYEIGIFFKDITEYQRDEIIKFIFEQQRKLRKKGLI